MNTRFSCFIRVIINVDFPAAILKTTSSIPIPYIHFVFVLNQRLPFVWLKRSVRILRSHLRVIGTEKWNRVMTVLAGYPGYPAQPEVVCITVKGHGLSKY